MHRCIDVETPREEEAREEADEQPRHNDFSEDDEAPENECDLTGRLTFTRIDEEEEGPSKASAGERVPPVKLMAKDAGFTPQEAFKAVLYQEEEPEGEESFSGESSIHSEGKMHNYAWEEEEEKLPSKVTSRELRMTATPQVLPRSTRVQSARTMRPAKEESKGDLTLPSQTAGGGTGETTSKKPNPEGGYRFGASASTIGSFAHGTQ